MRKLLMMALVAITFFACSEEEPTVVDYAGKTSLAVKIDLSKFSTRSGDALVGTMPEWSHLLLVAKNNTRTETRERLISKSDFGAMTEGIVNIFEKESVNFTGGVVEAFIITEGNDWNATNPISTSNLPVLALGQKDINNWQPSGNIKAGIAGRFVNVPYFGSGDIINNGPGGDGHEQLSATVSVTPELGRVQVLNQPKTGGEKNGFRVTALNVENVYINHLNSNDVVQDIREGGENSINNWETLYYADSKPLAGMTDSSTDKGYQIFDSNKPHIIVKVSYQLNSNTSETYTGYLTLTKFTYGNTTKGDLVVAKGKIYDVDLSLLTPAYDQIGDEPYDNTTYYDLSVTVTVNPWSKVVVTPEL